MNKLTLAIILRTLLAAGGNPLTAETIKTAVRGCFPGVAFTEADLTQRIRECEHHGWVIGTEDDLIGQTWALTVKGKLRAQQL